MRFSTAICKFVVLEHATSVSRISTSIIVIENTWLVHLFSAMLQLVQLLFFLLSANNAPECVAQMFVLSENVRGKTSVSKSLEILCRTALFVQGMRYQSEDLGRLQTSRCFDRPCGRTCGWNRGNPWKVATPMFYLQGCFSICEHKAVSYGEWILIWDSLLASVLLGDPFDPGLAYNDSCDWLFQATAHKEPHIKCPKCDKAFHYKSRLRMHLENHDRVPVNIKIKKEKVPKVSLCYSLFQFNHISIYILIYVIEKTSKEAKNRCSRRTAVMSKV